MKDFPRDFSLSRMECKFLTAHDGEMPVMDERLSVVEQMEQHCRDLAGICLSEGIQSTARIKRAFAQEEKTLTDIEKTLAAIVTSGQKIHSIAGWLMDNFYIIHTQTRRVHSGLKTTETQHLPAIAGEQDLGSCRIGRLMTAIVSCTGARVDLPILQRLVSAYQQRTPLLLKEIRLIPAGLGFALLQTARRTAVHLTMADIAARCASRQIADTEATEKTRRWTTCIRWAAAQDGMRRAVFLYAFTQAFDRQLAGEGGITPLLEKAGITKEIPGLQKLLSIEAHAQAVSTILLRNSIASLRQVGYAGWDEFLLDVSPVAKALMNDPAEMYAGMDLHTRDRYDRVIEGMACHGIFPEHTVAELAVDLASRTTKHVGHYLFGRDKRQLEERIHFKPSLKEKGRRLAEKYKAALYFGSIFFLTIALSLLVCMPFLKTGAPGWTIAILLLPVCIVACKAAIQVTDWTAAWLIEPSLLPRMDYSKGVPPPASTLVVIPAICDTIATIDKLVLDLEIRYLANKDPHIWFALLTDFGDAPEMVMPEDGALLRHLTERLSALDQRYARPFFLFHRPRRWNDSENCWMGEERKRGKLSDLNRYLRGGGENAFCLMRGDQSLLPRIKYVITLDEDTLLPRETAWKLIGTMAHPLNQPLYHPGKGRVTEGYGMLQPRIATTVPGRPLSRYARMHGNSKGIDPYTMATADTYQDIFGEGSFTGKGIYDVDIFIRGLSERLPSNRILSHDLLEGCYIRSGLVSDVKLYEEYPSSYLADASRRRRWTRGDWQIAAWIKGKVPGGKGRSGKNPLSFLSRWKIADNLRRSLEPSACLLTLTASILFSAHLSTAVIMTILLLPGLLAFIRSSFRSVSSLIPPAFTILVLPFETYYTANAIIRTLFRLTIGHKHLLEWRHSAADRYKKSLRWYECFRAMWPSLVITGTILSLAVLKDNGWLMVPVLAWMTSPLIVWAAGRTNTLPARSGPLSGDQVLFLRRIARKTWAYFDNFTGPGENWLPPDCFQEYPLKKISHITSPTNMGLSMLATLAAGDFGYLPAGEMLRRISGTLHTMSRLERYKGHFYNWYDTHLLQPGRPAYVSTVDSGNLAGHLLTLRQGLTQLPQQPVFTTAIFQGLKDTLLLVKEEMTVNTLLRSLMTAVDKAAGQQPLTLLLARDHLEKIIQLTLELNSSAQSPDKDNPVSWLAVFAQQVLKAREELLLLAPWVLLGPPPQTALFPEVEHDAIPSLDDLASKDQRLDPLIQNLLLRCKGAEKTWLLQYTEYLSSAARTARDRKAHIEVLTGLCTAFSDMDYQFLYNSTQRLLSIGYNTARECRDSGCYDLLASEARMAVFVAIAQGRLPQESWFALGRPLTRKNGRHILQSWSGSMFEYLMPQLVMPLYKDTLLEQACINAVDMHIGYNNGMDKPWGISECAYAEIDINLSYQYGPAGVPGLGLQRGLENHLVIAPYASMLALMARPGLACINLQRLSKEGMEGRFGFYEAVDYTPHRLPAGSEKDIIRSFMTHHQGMGLLSIASALLDNPMQQRFASAPECRSTLLLLSEQLFRDTAFRSEGATIYEKKDPVTDKQLSAATRICTDHDLLPMELQLLSNGRYHVMLTRDGTGYSRWKDLSVTRWRSDRLEDDKGAFCYVRKIGEEPSSVTFRPLCRDPQRYKTVFTGTFVDFYRTGHSWDTHTSVMVSSEEDLELRRITLCNKTETTAVFEITSYLEIVLAPQADECWHPAFSNLFAHTEIDPELHMVLGTRRSLSGRQSPPWMFHTMKVHDAKILSITYETDRLKFIGRGNTVSCPDAIMRSGDLSGSQGAVLDPIAAIRYVIELEGGASTTIDMITGVQDGREACQKTAIQSSSPDFITRQRHLALTQENALLKKLNIDSRTAQLFMTLAAPFIYPDPAWRTSPGNTGPAIHDPGCSPHLSRSRLQDYHLSGDLPLLLLEMEDLAGIQLLEQLLQAHAYWRRKGLYVDMVVLNTDNGHYRRFLHDQIMDTIGRLGGADISGRKGAVCLLDQALLPEEDRLLLMTMAHVVLSGNTPSLTSFRGSDPTPSAPSFTLPPASIRTDPYSPAWPAPPWDPDISGFCFFNGLGGFTEDGMEYVIKTSHDKKPPLPWVNVIANPVFGSVVSESGSSYTWAHNAHEFRLTPWHNDPVTDASGEAFYLRDEDTGKVWSPFPFPAKGAGPYLVRHGFGYSSFEHQEDDIHSLMTVYTDVTEALKFFTLRVTNHSGKHRRLSTTGYMHWVLGGLPASSSMHIRTETGTDGRAVFANHPLHQWHSGDVAFLAVDGENPGFTTDRTEFIGPHRSLSNPLAMERRHLSGSSGMNVDACAALRVFFDLDGTPDSSHNIVFVLGCGKDKADAAAMARRSISPAYAADALENVRRYWQRTLGVIRISTPDKALDILSNGWLLYQTLACRLWARSGFYQSGGAFGFRDQLQDILALLHAEPALAKQQILTAAARQFREGDAQHWWHPPFGGGVRTHCSDDLLWLPFAVLRYISFTGDTQLLQAEVPFLEAGALNPDEHSVYSVCRPSADTASVYEHCCRAIRHACKMGAHGLPLIGSGDWNDGMDRVGRAGKGESVWLAFFLYDVLTRFADLAENNGDMTFSIFCRNAATSLQTAIERYGWDGDWYRRAYYDDGAPLGSASCTECRIDSISQSWSVLSGSADPLRARQAVMAARRRLVDDDPGGIIRLMDPPFNTTPQDPGYIKAYPPGVRENGGQYTHAAIWMAMAFGKMGDATRCWELLHMLNPIRHGDSYTAIQQYMVEPYVMAADIYDLPGYPGRGGWTWYTGSAGWMYQLITEVLLGLKKVRHQLSFHPRLPQGWSSCSIRYRYGSSTYHISLKPVTTGSASVLLDGRLLEDGILILADDGAEHLVDVFSPCQTFLKDPAEQEPLHVHHT